MEIKTIGKTILFLTIPLAVLLIIVSLYGIYSPEAYSKETLNWKVQSHGQDFVDLYFVLPVLFLTAIFSYAQKKSAMLMWAGCILYLIYTFLIYCFDVHFNNLFLIYCSVLGLSFYSLIYLFYVQVSSELFHFSNTKHQPIIIGIYILVISILFYFLWLSEIIQAMISNITPASLVEAGLITNPVHILDIAVVLPGIFITGVLLLRRKLLGYILTPMLLTFFVLMDVTIGYLTYDMHEKELFVNTKVIWVMGTLALVSLGVLWKFFARKLSE